MPVRPIITEPDPRLRQVSTSVEHFDEQLRALANDLRDTLAASGAIGLCAPQIGHNTRVILVHVAGDDFGHSLYINPVVTNARRPGYIDESCLSVPGIEGSVSRPTRITVKAQDINGAPFEREVHGLHAVCIQHELDHLDGILFTDRLAWFSRLRLRLTGALDNRHAA